MSSFLGDFVSPRPRADEFAPCPVCTHRDARLLPVGDGVWRCSNPKCGHEVKK